MSVLRGGLVQQRESPLIAVSSSRRRLNILAHWRDDCRHYAAGFIILGIYAQGDSGQFVLRLHLAWRAADRLSNFSLRLEQGSDQQFGSVCLLPDEAADPGTRGHCCVSVVQDGSVPHRDPSFRFRQKPLFSDILL